MIKNTYLNSEENSENWKRNSKRKENLDSVTFIAMDTANDAAYIVPFTCFKSYTSFKSFTAILTYSHEQYHQNIT